MMRRVGRIGMSAMAGQTLWAAHRQWRAIPRVQRRRFVELIQRSGGRPANLSASERAELAAFVRDYDLGGLARQTALRAASRLGPRHRWR